MEYLQQLTHATKLEKLDSLKQLAFIQEKTGQKPSTIIVLSLAVLVLFALLFDISTFVISVVCCLVPAFESFLALESPAEDDDIKYLTYWIVFSLS